MIKASVDIGSNSILLLICEVNEEGLKVLENQAHVTGLGRDLDKNKKFLDESMYDSLTVLKEYSRIIQKYKIEQINIIATATEASRVAENASEFYKKVSSETCIKVSIISGEAEAFYSTIGILADTKIKDEEIVIMDIGGASTELIKVQCKEKKILKSFSMPVGAVRMTNWQEHQIENKRLNSIYNDFKDSINEVSCSKLFCVAGTMTSVGNMLLGHKEFLEDDVNGLEISTNNVLNLLEKCDGFTPEIFLRNFPFLGKRSATIRAGLILSTTIFSWLNTKDLYISTYGLRYGTLLEGSIRDEFIVKQF